MKRILFATIISLSFFGCIKNEACKYDACTVVAPASEIQAVQNYLSANAIIATQHCSGVFYRIETNGTGATPDYCSDVNVAYEGKLTNGTVFDQNASATFNLSGLIIAWRNTIPLIKSGGKIHLYIPPSLGYGSSAVGTIPANSILIFKIDLLGVR